MVHLFFDFTSDIVYQNPQSQFLKIYSFHFSAAKKMDILIDLLKIRTVLQCRLKQNSTNRENPPATFF